MGRFEWSVSDCSVDYYGDLLSDARDDLLVHSKFGRTPSKECWNCMAGWIWKYWCQWNHLLNFSWGHRLRFDGRESLPYTLFCKRSKYWKVAVSVSFPLLTVNAVHRDTSLQFCPWDHIMKGIADKRNRPGYSICIAFNCLLVRPLWTKWHQLMSIDPRFAAACTAWLAGAKIGTRRKWQLILGWLIMRRLSCKPTEW